MKTQKIPGHNVCEELNVLKERYPTVVAALSIETKYASETLLEYADGKAKGSAFEAHIAQFLDDHAHCWGVMEEEGNYLRAQFGSKLIGNLKALSEILERTADLAGKLVLRAAMGFYLDEMDRLVTLMGAEETQSPEQLAAALRSLLRPGDRMLISRAGGNDEPIKGIHRIGGGARKWQPLSGDES